MVGAAYVPTNVPRCSWHTVNAAAHQDSPCPWATGRDTPGFKAAMPRPRITPAASAATNPRPRRDRRRMLLLTAKASSSKEQKERSSSTRIGWSLKPTEGVAFAAAPLSAALIAALPQECASASGPSTHLPQLKWKPFACLTLSAPGLVSAAERLQAMMSKHETYRQQVSTNRRPQRLHFPMMHPPSFLPFLLSHPCPHPPRSVSSSALLMRRLWLPVAFHRCSRRPTERARPTPSSGGCGLRFRSLSRRGS